MPRVDPRYLHEVYSALFASLTLSPAHRQALRKRGLSDEQIELRQYRTLPAWDRAALARRLVEQFGPETCSGIPGLYVRKQCEQSWWSLAGAAGLLIPIRDVVGRMIALRVRTDELASDQPRYSWISSRKHGGPGPGAVAHVPLFNGATHTVRLTEGELKADVATALTGILTLSLPGVALINSVVPIIRELRPERTLIAFDADWRTNRHVQRALESALRTLESM